MSPVIAAMKTQVFAPETRLPKDVLQSLIADHGAWRTFRAFLTALAQKESRPLPLAGVLNRHLLRDIGLDAPPDPEVWQGHRH